MRKIPLTKGKFTLIDDEDFEFLNQWHWCINNGYAFRGTHKNKKYIGIRMHSLLMNPPKGMQVDHINGDRLDNRKINLRIITQQQNLLHRISLNKNNTSGFRGIYWNKLEKVWKAQITINYKYINLGSFKDIKDALLAHEKVLKENYLA